MRTDIIIIDLYTIGSADNGSIIIDSLTHSQIHSLTQSLITHSNFPVHYIFLIIKFAVDTELSNVGECMHTHAPRA